VTEIKKGALAQPVSRLLVTVEAWSRSQGFWWTKWHWFLCQYHFTNAPYSFIHLTAPQYTPVTDSVVKWHTSKKYITKGRKSEMNKRRKHEELKRERKKKTYGEKK